MAASMPSERRRRTSGPGTAARAPRARRPGKAEGRGLALEGAARRRRLKASWKSRERWRPVQRSGRQTSRTPKTAHDLWQPIRCSDVASHEHANCVIDQREQRSWLRSRVQRPLETGSTTLKGAYWAAAHALKRNRRTGLSQSISRGP